MKASATSPRASFSLFPLIALTALLCIACIACSEALAQAASADYTADLPSVERVKAEIKGSDPTDTLARQVAVFTYLQVYVQRIKYNRTVRGPYTPGEQRVMGAYSLAAYQISQDYAKSHTPDEAKAFEHLHGQYEMNSDFYQDWSKRLIGKQSAAAYKGAEAGLTASHQRFEEQIQRDMAPMQPKTNAQGLSNDPTAVATRRCLELGGNSIACMGKGFGAGLMGLVGLDTTKSLLGPSRAAVVLSGVYHNRGTLANINFSSDSAAIQDCGKLVADGHGYTIRKSPNSLEVLIQNEPRPIVLSMRPDGALAGPGLVDVKGRIIVGYHTVSSTLMIDGRRAYGAECNGPCTTYTQVPDYAPKIERCMIATLAPPPPPAPASASAQDGGGLFGMLGSMINTVVPASEPGLRMVGQYAGSSGLLLDFDGAAVTLDCGQAHVKQPYTVENAPNELVVHVQNSGGPFNLAVLPDNSLRGSGNTTVNGRLVSGMRGDDVTYTPHSERCDIGAFRPATGSGSGGVVASLLGGASPTPVENAAANSAPVSAASSPAPVARGSAAPSSPAAITMRIAVSSTFPAGANPLAGQGVFIMKERMDEVLRKLGVPIPPNTTPGKAMQMMGDRCRTTDCRPIFAGLIRYYVATTTLDSTGQTPMKGAQFSLGDYFVFALVRTPNGSMVWDVPTNLHAGDNTITLTASNAEAFH